MKKRVESKLWVSKKVPKIKGIKSKRRKIEQAYKINSNYLLELEKIQKEIKK